jgi:hypothetical protein
MAFILLSYCSHIAFAWLLADIFRNALYIGLAAMTLKAKISVMCFVITPKQHVSRLLEAVSTSTKAHKYTSTQS